MFVRDDGLTNVSPLCALPPKVPKSKEVPHGFRVWATLRAPPPAPGASCSDFVEGMALTNL